VKAALGVVGLALLLAIGPALFTAYLDDLRYTSGPADAGPDDRCAPG